MNVSGAPRAGADIDNDIAQKKEFLQQVAALQQSALLTEKPKPDEAHTENATSIKSRAAQLPIGEEQITKAMETLLKYKEKKTGLDAQIAENEEFWKMNHWDVMEGEKETPRIKPRSGWLFNTIINKHADAMDNYPEANILPRAKDDEETARALSKVIPVIMEQNNYEQVYSDTQWYKEKNGVAVQGVFWDNEKANGLGDIEVKKIDILNLFWKWGISNIQESPHLFHVKMVDNEELRERYPQLSSATLGNTWFSDTEAYKQNEDTSTMTPVIDWYYKKRVMVTDDSGVQKTVTKLHFCKFCNKQVLYASENDPNYAQRGWYDHGKYPFVFDVLFPIEKSVCGMGYIDVTKDDQLYIDKLQQSILESAIVNARPRYFIKNDGSISEKEFTDLTKFLIHVDGSLGDDSIKPVQNSNFNAVYETVYLNKIQELKDTSGNTASSQGQTSSVTSASGIASLQEAAGKLSRDANTASYRAYKEVVDLVIELIRQFYDEPRCFRITGDNGKPEFVNFDNSGLIEQPQGKEFGIDFGSRRPIMDIDVRPQKRSAYSKEAQNQTALNLYNMGFFAPNNADSSLACLEMMEFDGVEKVKGTVRNNGTLFQLVLQLQQQLAAAQEAMLKMGLMLDQQNGTNIVPQIAGEATETEQAVAQKVASGNAGKSGGEVKNSNGSLSSQAASATRGSTAPR